VKSLRLSSPDPCRVLPGATGLLLALVASLLPELAAAHSLMDEGAGLRSGLAHPLTGPDHFLAMFAVGLWGAQLGGARVWELPVTFPLVMVVGGILGILGLPFPQVELAIAVSVLVLGTAIGVAWRPPLWVALGLVSFFAIAHGYAHGMELPRAADPTDFATGFVAATGLIHVLGIGAGFALQKPLNGRLIRYLGIMIALSGVYFLIA
jgi:urease accessory protein